MASDDKVFRLTWIFDGKRFTAEINEATANAIAQSGAVEKADISLTNVTVVNARKRVDAHKSTIPAANDASRAQVTAAGNASAAFGPATDRVITYTSTLNRQLTAVESKLGIFSRAVLAAEANVDKLNNIIAKAAPGSEQASRAANLLAVAYQQLADAQDKAALSANDNLSALDQAARNLRNSIDPLSVAQRDYGQSVAVADQLLEKHRITLDEYNEAIKLARFNFEATATAIRKDATTTYNALIAASDKYKAALISGRVTGSSTPTSPQLTSAATLSTSLQTNITSGKPVDPLTLESTRQLTQELNKLAAEEEAASVSSQKLRDSLDPIGAVERELSVTMAGYLDLLGRGKISVDEFTAAQNRARSAAGGKISDLKGVTAAADDYERLASTANKYQETFNPLIAAQNQYNEYIAKGKELASVKLLTDRVSIQALADYEQKQQKITAALKIADDEQLTSQQITKRFSPLLKTAQNDFINFSSTVNKGFGLNRAGFLELQAAGVNTFQSLAAGISPLRTATTEGAQVLGGLVQLGLPLRTLAAIALPLTALSVVILGLVSRIISVNSNLKEFKATLDTVARGSNQTPESLQKIIDSFKSIGVASDDAKKAINEVLKSTPQGLNTSFTKQILQTALDISKVPTATTGDLTSDVQALVAALTGGVKGLEDYGRKIGALRQPELDEMDRLARLGQTTTAIQYGFGKISEVFAGKYPASLSSGKLAVIELIDSWNKLIDSISESKAFTDLITKLTDATNSLREFMKDADRVKNFFDTLGGVAGGALIGGRIAGPLGAVIGGGIGGFKGVSGTVEDAKKVSDAWNKASKVWDDFQESLGAVPPGRSSPNEKDVSKTVDATKDLTKSLDENKKSLDNYTSSLKSSSGNTQERIGIVRDVRTESEKVAETVTRTSSANSVKQQVIDWLVNHGYTATATSAIAGNAAVESSFNPAAQTGSHFGLFQWDKERGSILQGSTDVIKQMELLDSELQKLDPTFKNITGDVPEATKRFEQKFERSGGQLEGRRESEAVAVSKTLATTQPSSTTAVENEEVVRRTKELDKAFADLTVRRREDLDILKKTPIDQEIAKAGLEAYRVELEKTTSQQDPLRAKTLAEQDAAARLGVEWSNQARIAGALAENTNKTTDAYQKSEVEGIRQAASTQAINEGFTSAIDVRQRYVEILRANATEAVLNAQKESTTFDQTLIANQKLVDATREGTSAAHDAEIENQVVAKTHNALALAEGYGNDTLIKRAKLLEDATRKQLISNDALTSTLSLEQAVNNIKNELAVTELQASLTASGATREDIDRRLNNLRAIQKVTQDTANATDESKQSYLDIVDAEGRWKTKLSEIEENQRRIDDVIKSIADSISTNLTSAIDDAFDQKKIESWGDRLKTILKDVIKSASEQLFLKPLLGSLADTLGFSSAATSLGTLTGTTSTTGTATTGQTTTTTGSKAGIGGNVTTGALGIGAATGSTGTLVNWLNTEIGPSLGFARPSTTLSSIEGSTASEFIVPASEGLLGTSTTLTGALGGAAVGLGAGGLTASLLGGNTTVGSAGGLVGGLAGSLLIPIPGVGSAIGGVLGGLTGLFGNNKKSADTAGGNINLSTGKVTTVTTSATAASNQDVSDITSSLNTFVKDLKKNNAGLSIDSSAYAVISSSVRDGITVGLGGGITGSGTDKTFTTAQDAIDQTELDLAKGLTGLSSTMKTVLDGVTDPTQIDDALKFAKSYDDLKKSADSAFTSISSDTDTLGVYATAMDDLNTTFADLTTSAEDFGLSLDPINKGLDEATKRLKVDFGKSLDAALDTASAKDYISTLQDVHDAFKSNIKEAQSIGLGTDADTQKKISELEVAKARTTLTTLTVKELNIVNDELKTTAPELALLAKDIINTGEAATDTSVALTTLTDGLKNIKDLATSLRTGKLSGLTDTATATSELKQYQRDLDTAIKAGDKVTGTQLTNVSTSGTDVINAYITAYGNAPKTAELRRTILADLDSLKTAAEKADSIVTTVKIPTSVAAEQATLYSSTVADTKDLTTKPATVAASTTSTATTAAAAETTPSVTATEGTSYTEGNVYYTGVNGGYVDLSHIGGAAMGSMSTPAGNILVGEKGPEWMGMPAYAKGTRNWSLVGRHGPEVINQPGGATILPFPIHPKSLPKFAMGTIDIASYLPKNIPSFATGTDFTETTFPNITDTTFPTINEPIGVGTGDGSSMQAVVVELRSLRKENSFLHDDLLALKKQVQGGQTQAMTDAKTGNSRLSSIDSKLGSGLVTPTRRAVG